MNAPMPEIVQGDARSLPLPDNSVDLIVSSPPYFGLRSYTDGGEHYAGQVGSEATPAEFIAELIECTREMVRVLKPSGSIFVNLGDKYAGVADGRNMNGIGGGLKTRGPVLPERRPEARKVSFGSVPYKSLALLPERYRIAAVDELGLIARAVLVWAKPNGLPESVTDRVRRSHEDWVHLVKSARYFAAVDEIREPHAKFLPNGKPSPRAKYGGLLPGEAAGKQSSKVGGPGDDNRRTDWVPRVNPLGKLPGSVWEIATQPLRVPAELGIDHFAAFPMEWPRRLILGWSPEAGVVLDPFGGTGTTALVATMLGRRGISVDLSADYCRLATWRAGDPKERARAAGLDPDQVAKVVPSLPGQFDLFGEAS